MLKLTWHDGPAWHERSRSTVSIYSETGDRRRRYHRKSRNGCVNCRNRRVKCSEDRPVCQSCGWLHVECHYSPQTRARRDGSNKTIVATATATNTASRELQRSAHARLTTLLPATLQAPAWPGTSIELDDDLSGFRLLVLSHAAKNLDHFVRCDRSWLKNDSIQAIMQHRAPSSVPGQPYLLHAVLAVSAAHLALISPDGGTHATVSLVHWQMFLRAYRHCLQGDLSASGFDVDAVFAASHLHSMLVSVHERRRDGDDVWSLPGWIGSMLAVKTLWDMPRIMARLRTGMWRPWTQSCEPAHRGVVAAVDPGRGGGGGDPPVLVVLRDHCRLVSDEHEARICQERIDFLAVVEDRLSSSEGLSCLSWYITRAPAEYFAMLRCGGEMALLLLLYWCRLALRGGQWWMVQAADYESEKLRVYLSRTHSSKMIVALLDRVMSV